MKLLKLVFSPTGGTAKAAEAVAAGISDYAESIDLTIPTDCRELTSDGLALIAMPSYGGRAPAAAIERLSCIKANGARAVLVCVYGNRAYEDTLVEMQDAAEKSGFKVIAAVAAIAEHSILHQYAAGRPDSRDLAQLKGFGESIAIKLGKGNDTVPHIPGARPYKKGGSGGMVPKAGKSCTLCGLCAENCPVGAINRDKLKTADSNKCISCMRCVVNCPANARSVNALLLSAASLALKKTCAEAKNNELFI